MYHGTSREKGNQIISSQTMLKSCGDSHWLGDGVYLYSELFLAFRWINIKYKEKYPLYQIDKRLLEEYMILKVELKCEHNRIFSFIHSTENLMEFDQIKKKYLEKAKDSKRISANDDNAVDGIVINLMFNSMGYEKEYDAVEAYFPYKGNSKLVSSRIGNIGEYQLCVKNLKCIGKISDCTEKINNEEYSGKLRRFNQYRTQRMKNIDF